MAKVLTSGSPAKLLILFAIPLLIGNLFQQFYNIADTFIVGRTLGLNALAAVGSTGSLMFLILGFTFGVTGGLSIITAQRFGAHDYAGVRQSIATSLVICLVMTLVFTGFSVPLAKNLLMVMQTPPEILADAYDYTLMIFYGTGAVLLFNQLSNMLRALGDSRTPLIVLAIACILNIVFDYLAILVLGWGVFGVGLATIAAQTVAIIITLLYIWQKYKQFIPLASDFMFNKKDYWLHLRTSIPMGFQTSIIALGAVAVQFVVNGLGTTAVAAYTAASRIDAFAVMPLMSFGIAMATFTAQNYGAKLYSRVRLGIKQAVIINIGLAILMGFIMIAFGRPLTRLFTDNKEVIGLSYQYFIVNGLCYWMLAILFIFRSALQGLGKTFYPTLSGFLELLMRAFAAFALTIPFGFWGAASSSPLAWLGACIPLTYGLYKVLKKLPL